MYSIIAMNSIKKCTPLKVPIALKLICERLKPSANWGPYIDMLPREIPHPLTFNPEDLMYLEGSPTYAEVLDLYCDVVKQYVKLYKHMQKHRGVCKNSHLLSLLSISVDRTDHKPPHTVMFPHFLLL